MTDVEAISAQNIRNNRMDPLCVNTLHIVLNRMTSQRAGIRQKSWRRLARIQNADIDHSPPQIFFHYCQMIGSPEAIRLSRLRHEIANQNLQRAALPNGRRNTRN